MVPLTLRMSSKISTFYGSLLDKMCDIENVGGPRIVFVPSDWFSTVHCKEIISNGEK